MLLLLLSTLAFADPDICIQGYASLLPERKALVDFTHDQQDIILAWKETAKPNDADYADLLKNIRTVEDPKLREEIVTLLPYTKAVDENSFAGRLWYEVTSLENLNKVEKKKYDEIHRALPNLPNGLKKELAKGAKVARKEKIKSCMFPRAGQGAAMAQFRKMAVKLGVGVTLITYPAYHWQEEKNARWFGKLAYELSIGVIMNVLTSTLVGAPTGTFAQKVGAQWLGAAGVGLGDMSAYSYWFGTDPKTAEKILNDLKKDPNFESNMKKLKAHLENPSWVAEMKRKIPDLVAKIQKEKLPSESRDKTLAGWDKITSAQFSDPQIREALLEAVELQLYAQKETLLKTGDAGVDRYTFNRAWDVPGYAWGTGVSLLIYRTICLNADNPAKGLRNAVLFYLMSRAITDQIYFPGRKEVIGL